MVVGYTTDVAHYLRLADFFIGKPGPGSLSEALHCGLPVIVTRNAWTMPEERYNTDWVREQVGITLTHLDGGYARFEAESDAAAQAVLARAVAGSTASQPGGSAGTGAFSSHTQVQRFGKLTPSLAQIFKEVVQ